jgi:hypothetical protein
VNPEKQIEEAHRRLDVRDRFRLLTDFIDAERKMIEVADHKARFALVIMGALNDAWLLLAMRGHLFDPVPEPVRPWLLVVLLPYGAVVFVFLLDAVRVLQPHMRMWSDVAAAAPAPLRGTEVATDERPLGLMYWGAAVTAEFPRYARLWTEARVGQAGTELALLAYELARVNAARTAGCAACSRRCAHAGAGGRPSVVLCSLRSDAFARAQRHPRRGCRQSCAVAHDASRLGGSSSCWHADC